MSVYGASSRYTWVHAYLPDATRDASFGECGIVDFPGDRRGVVAALAQPDGRILVASSGVSLPRSDPDPTFGGSGTIQPGLGGAESSLGAAALQADGRLVLAGTRGDDSIVVTRYLRDGSPDPSFASGGTVELVRDGLLTAGLAVQPGGGLLVSTSRKGEPLIARLSPDGRVDESFGRHAHALVMADGRIRLAVSLHGADQQTSRMSLIGLTKEGHPDTTFGVGGIALGPQPTLPGYGDDVETIGGEAVDGAVMDDHALIRRFRPNGRLDLSFGNRGVVNFGPPPVSYTGIAQRLALLGEDRLIAVEYALDVTYLSSHSTKLRALNVGYDDEPPAISVVVRSCRSVGIHVRDLSVSEQWSAPEGA